VAALEPYTIYILPHLFPPAQLMERKVLKNKREQLRRGKKTLFKKAHRLSKAYDIDIAIIKLCTRMVSISLTGRWTGNRGHQL
jgi:hypothetical protein